MEQTSDLQSFGGGRKNNSFANGYLASPTIVRASLAWAIFRYLKSGWILKIHILTEEKFSETMNI